MRSLVQKYKHKPVLLLGCSDYVHVAEHYGFECTYTVADLCAAKPELWPFFSHSHMHDRMLATSASALRSNSNLNWPAEGIQAVIQLTDAVDWAVELQVPPS